MHDSFLRQPKEDTSWFLGYTPLRKYAPQSLLREKSWLDNLRDYSTVYVCMYAVWNGNHSNSKGQLNSIFEVVDVGNSLKLI